MSSAVTSRPNAAPTPETHPSGFIASRSLRTNLQLVLVDLIELHLQGKQAHWNIVGTNFRELHLLLDEIVDSARQASDTIAERMRALHSNPDGSSESVTTTTSLHPFPAGQVNTATAVHLISRRLTAVAARARAVLREVDDEDPISADLLHAVIEAMEKYAWLVGAGCGG